MCPASDGEEWQRSGEITLRAARRGGATADLRNGDRNSGRVRVKADAAYGAITAGDLVVTSPTLGYAMRSESVELGGVTFHRPGTLLGKALEGLPSGRGDILILVTLQ